MSYTQEQMDQFRVGDIVIYHNYWWHDKVNARITLSYKLVDKQRFDLADIFETWNGIHGDSVLKNLSYEARTSNKESNK